MVARDRRRAGGAPDELPARLLQLFVGLALFGISIGLMVRARLGLDPWDVLHQGIAMRVDVPIGWVIIGAGAVVLMAWIPLRQRPGLGTMASVLVVGLATNLALVLLPVPRVELVQATFLVVGVIANGVATALYIGAGLGPGPRDGLMVGLAKRGISIKRARTGLELGVLVTGFALGGTVGIGTILYAVSIGPLAAFFLPRLARPVRDVAAQPKCAGSAR